MQKPIIPFTIAYLAGLVLGHGFLYFPCSIGIMLALGIGAGILLIRLDRLALRDYLLIVIPCSIGSLMYIMSAARVPQDHYTHILTADRSSHEITGIVSSSLDRDPDRTGFALDMSMLDNAHVSGTIRVSVREATPSLGYGDTVQFSAKLFEPRGFLNPSGFDYAAYLARSGIRHLASVKKADDIRIMKRGNGIFRQVQDWRERIRQAFLASLTGPGSAILQAMVLGEEGALTDEVRDRFMAAGVTHIISISGSHLGMFAVLCFGLLRWLLFLLPENAYHRLTLLLDPKKMAAWLTLPLVVFYTLLAGGQVATVRSLVMISAGLAALVLDRDHILMNALALAALGILLMNPQSLFDISFQLSFLSVLVIGSVVSLWTDLQFTSDTWLQKTGKSILLLSIISLATGIATGPLAAYYFNQVSLAGIVSNLIVVPFAGMVVVPLGLLSGVLSLFPGHLPFAGLNQMVSDAFIGTVSFFSRLPFAAFHPPAPGILWLLLYGLFLVLLSAFIRRKVLFRFKPLESSSRVPRAIIIGMAITGPALLLPLALSLFPDAALKISFPDVGQGDCSLIELPGGKTILIDGGGTYDNRFDIGQRVLAPYLRNRGIRRLDLVVLSHPHPDHMNGLRSIVHSFDVSEVWDSGLDHDLPGYDVFEQTLLERGIRRRALSADDSPCLIDGTEIRVLHPAPGFAPRGGKAYTMENNRSLVVRIKTGDTVLLFTGDIGIEAEKRLLRSENDLHADLVKVPHHGSKSSSSGEFAARVRPKVAVVTVGRENPYRHPSDEVIDRYRSVGAQIFRTDTGGELTLRMNRGHVDVVQWQDRMLRKITPDRADSWLEREADNWKRVKLRTAAF